MIGRPLSLIQGAASEELDLGALVESANRGEPAEAVLMHYTKQRRAFRNHLRITPIYGAQGAARQVRVFSESVEVLWTPRSTPRVRPDPQTPLRMSPRLGPVKGCSGRDPVDVPGGREMMNVALMNSLNGSSARTPQLPARSASYVPPTPRQPASMPSSPLISMPSPLSCFAKPGDFNQKQQERILSDARQRRHTVSDVTAGWASPLMKEVPRAASGFSTPLSGAFPTTPNFGGSPMASPAQSGSSPGGEVGGVSCARRSFKRRTPGALTAPA